LNNDRLGLTQFPHVLPPVTSTSFHFWCFACSHYAWHKPVKPQKPRRAVCALQFCKGEQKH
jgi:hypothetical protein